MNTTTETPRQAMIRRAQERRARVEAQLAPRPATRPGLKVHYAPFGCAHEGGAETTNDESRVTCGICRTHLPRRTI